MYTTAVAAAPKSTSIDIATIARIGVAPTRKGSVPDVADHSLANSSVWYAAVAALVLVAAWRRRRHIGNRSAIGAVVATVIIPPWIIPGAGVIVLAIVRVVQCSRAAELVDAAPA